MKAVFYAYIISNMKSVLSIIVSFVFLMQSFATVQVMPLQQDNAEMACVIKKETSKKHTCCVLKNIQKEQSEKKNCCSGTSKMSCCIAIIAIAHQPEVFSFLPMVNTSVFYGYTESLSNYSTTIFHPPILV